MKNIWWICVIVAFIELAIELWNRGDVSLTPISSLIIAMIGYWGNRIEDKLDKVLKEQNHEET